MISTISSSQKFTLSLNSLTKSAVFLNVESRTDTSLSSLLTDSSMLETAVVRLLRRTSLSSNLSDLDS